MIKDNSRKKNISFENPISGGYQTFKKAFGLGLVLIALYTGMSIAMFGISAIKGDVNLADNSFIKQIVPEDGASRSLRLTIPTKDQATPVETIIEVPKNMLLISALIVGILIFGIIARLIVALLNGGIGLMKDDVSFVFERLRKEIERNRIPDTTTVDQSYQDKL